MTQPASPIVLVGVGEMGGVFAKALLKAGHTIVPVTRSTPMDFVASRVSEPSLVLITVGEPDLPSVLGAWVGIGVV